MSSLLNVEEEARRGDERGRPGSANTITASR
jgi:hypothetical protein